MRHEKDDALPAVLLATLADGRLCDVALVGNDGRSVRAPRYLLAAHSAAFMELLYPAPGAAGTGPGAGTKNAAASPAAHAVELAFAGRDALDAAVRFLVSRSLPPGAADAGSVRTLCQIHLVGRLFDVAALAEAACNRARVLMNQHPPLACAAFDECRRAAARMAPAQRRSAHLVHLDELKEYAWDYMRENPGETLLAEGTHFLNADSIEAIICDQEIDLDNTTMFNMLSSWVKQDKDNIEVGKRLVANIQLCHMKPDHLKYEVKKCGFVDAADVDAALKEIEEALVNESPDDKEHVLVTGAGLGGVNGMYVRLKEDIGMAKEEVVFVKEGGEEDDYGPDYNLFLRRSTWAITLSADSSNLLYSCEVTQGSILPRAPGYGWQTVAGEDPPPTCTWSRRKADRLAVKNYVAPNLASTGTSTRNINGDYGDGGERRRSLGSMLALPADESYENDDYRGLAQDDLQQMLSLPIDEGHEEGDYRGSGRFT